MAALTVHIPRGDVLTPLVGDTGLAGPDLAISEELAQYCLLTGNVRVAGHSFAFPLNSGGGVAAVVSGVLAPGLDPQAMDLPRRLSAPRPQAQSRHRAPRHRRAVPGVPRLGDRRGTAPAGPRDARRRRAGDGVARLLRRRPRRQRAARAPTAAPPAAACCASGSPWSSARYAARSRPCAPSIGENDSLGTAIGSLARHLSASSGIPIHVTLDERTTRLRPEVESELLRIAQEAMTNAVRHSGCAGDQGPVPGRSPDRRDRGAATTAAASAPAATTRTGWRSCASAPPSIGADLDVADNRPSTARRGRPSAPARRTPPSAPDWRCAEPTTADPDMLPA